MRSNAIAMGLAAFLACHVSAQSPLRQLGARIALSSLRGQIATDPVTPDVREARSHYFKVEICGRLRVDSLPEDKEFRGQLQFGIARAMPRELLFAEDLALRKRARDFNGKRVIITGELITLLRLPPVGAGPAVQSDVIVVKTLAAADERGEVLYTDPLTKREGRIDPGLNIACQLRLSPDGKTLFFGRATFNGLGMGGVVKRLDLALEKEGKAIDELHLHFHTMALSPDGTLLAVGGGHPIPMGSNPGHVVLWDIAAHKPSKHLSFLELDQPVHDIAFAADGKTVVTAGHGNVLVWDVATAKVVHRLEKRGDFTAAIAFLDSRHLIAVGQTDSRRRDRPLLRFWHAQSGKELDVFPDTGVALKTPLGHSPDALCVNAIAVSPKARIFATAAGFVDKAELKLWRLVKAPETIDLVGHKGQVHALAFSGDGAMLASAGADGTIKLWDVATGKEKTTFRGHDGAVTSVVFARDGTTLFSAGNDRTIRRWDLRK